MKNVDEMSVFEEYIHKTHTHTTGYEWMRKYLLLMREGEKEIKKLFIAHRFIYDSMTIDMSEFIEKNHVKTVEIKI